MGRGGRCGMGIGRVKKYKSGGVGNWQKISWDEPTGGDGGLEERKGRFFGQLACLSLFPIVF